MFAGYPIADGPYDDQRQQRAGNQDRSFHFLIGRFRRAGRSGVIELYPPSRSLRMPSESTGQRHTMARVKARPVGGGKI